MLGFKFKKKKKNLDRLHQLLLFYHYDKRKKRDCNLYVSFHEERKTHEAEKRAWKVVPKQLVVKVNVFIMSQIWGFDTGKAYFWYWHTWVTSG